MLGLGLVIPVLNALVDESKFAGIVAAPILGDLIRFIGLDSNKSIFVLLIGLIFIAVCLENLCLVLGRYYSVLIDTKLTAKLRNKLFSKFLQFNRSYFRTNNTAEIIATLTNFINTVSRTTNNFTVFIIHGIFAVVFLVLMAIISWKLTLLSLLLLPVIHLLTKFFSTKIYHSSKLAQTDLNLLNTQVDDAYGNLSLVQLANQQEAEAERFTKRSWSLAQNLADVRLRSFYVPALTDSFNAAGALLIVAASVFIFFTFGSYSVGRLLVFFVSLRRFISSIQQISGTIVQAIAELPGVKNVDKFFTMEDPYPIISGEKDFTVIKEKIEFKNVTFNHHLDQDIITNLNLEIPVGTVVALVGPSGAGKSTLIDLVPRFNDPESGSLLIDGVDIKELNLENYRSKIALVSQRSQLFNATILDNLTYGLEEVSQDQINHALEVAQLTELINKLPDGLGTLVGTHGAKLSGGESQRLSIARAVLQDPEILILDEPTSALDAETESNLEIAFKKIIPGKTVLIIAHRLKTIEKADKIVFLEHGKIQESGNSKELVELKGNFYKYYQLQNFV